MTNEEIGELASAEASEDVEVQHLQGLVAEAHEHAVAEAEKLATELKTGSIDAFMRADATYTATQLPVTVGGKRYLLPLRYPRPLPKGAFAPKAPSVPKGHPAILAHGMRARAASACVQKHAEVRAQYIALAEMKTPEELAAIWPRYAAKAARRLSLASTAEAKLKARQRE